MVTGQTISLYQIQDSSVSTDKLESFTTTDYINHDADGFQYGKYLFDVFPSY